VSTEHHDGLGLILLDKGFSKIPEELRQGSAFARGHSRDVHEHNRGRMGEEECGDLLRSGRKVIECLKPLVPGLWRGHSHGCGGFGGGGGKISTQGGKEERQEDGGSVLSASGQSAGKGVHG